MDVMHEIIYLAVDDVNATLPLERKIIKSPDTRLLGKDVLLDSIQLVSFVMSIEEVILDLIGKDITLLTEEAMAREPSPLASLNNLNDYVIERLAQAQDM